MLAALLELAPAGVEQVDGEDEVEYAVYGAPGELPALPEGEALVGGVRVLVSGSEVADDWAERWRRFHQPVLVAGRVYLRPPWEERSRHPGVVDVAIDPGQAFGTGAHPTTRLCVELLVGLAGAGRAKNPLADLGCGSGVLAIAAAKLGWDPVTAIDSEATAVATTIANARDNGVALERVERVDLRDHPLAGAETVTANLMRPLLLQLAGRFDPPPRTLILSGLLEHEADEVAAAFRPLREMRRLSCRGWSAMVLQE